MFPRKPLAALFFLLPALCSAHTFFSWNAGTIGWEMLLPGDGAAHSLVVDAGTLFFENEETRIGFEVLPFRGRFRIAGDDNGNSAIGLVGVTAFWNPLSFRGIFADSIFGPFLTLEPLNWINGDIALPTLAGGLRFTWRRLIYNLWGKLGIAAGTDTAAPYAYNIAQVEAGFRYPRGNSWDSPPAFFVSVKIDNFSVAVIGALIGYAMGTAELSKLDPAAKDPLIPPKTPVK